MTQLGHLQYYSKAKQKMNTENLLEMLISLFFHLSVLVVFVDPPNVQDVVAPEINKNEEGVHVLKVSLRRFRFYQT